MISRLIAAFDREALIALTRNQFFQVTVLIVAVGLIARVACRQRPHLAYLLWLLVLAKCCLPPVWHSPMGIFCWAWPGRSAVSAAEAARAARAAASPKIRSEKPSPEIPPKPRLEQSLSEDSSSEFPAPPFERAGEWSAAPADAFGDWFAIWFAGAALCMTIWVANAWRWRRRVRRATLPAEAVRSDVDIRDIVHRLARRLRLRRPPRVVVAKEAIGPAVFGLFRPVVVLPEFLLARCPRHRLTAIVAHELIHVRRGDLLIGLWQLATQAAWWFHPLVWWANRELARERERSCDEEVLATLGGEPADYAQSLLDVLKLRRERRFLPAWPGMRASEITRRRFEHIVRHGRSAHARTPRVCWLLAIAALLVVLPGAKRVLRPAAAEDERADAATKIRSDQESDRPGTIEVTPADRKAAAQAPSAEPRRERALERAIAYLKLEQDSNGSWNDPAGYPGGITALCTLALLKSGEPADGIVVREALEYLRDVKPAVTYSTALALMVFSVADPARDRSLIEQGVAWLEETQKKAGLYAGAWGYPQAEGDNSNTSFAVRALYAAHRAGVSGSAETWRRTLKHWLRAQNDNGSWGYKDHAPGSGSMTAAGLFCLQASSEVLGDDLDAETRGKATAAAEHGGAWLSRNFSVKENPASDAAQGWRLYYLDALGEAAAITRRKMFGDHDWLAEGTRLLVAEQHDDGYWTGTGHAEDNRQVATAFALLFLSHEHADQK